jgi:vacuolar-type H+-ATPase subunit C/Vma6
MSLTGRADFGYGNTRLRARRGDLLRRADFERLVGTDLARLLTALEGTPYAARTDAEHRDDALRRLHATIRTELGAALEEMRSFYSGRAREIVDELLSRFDVDNLVTVLRAHAGTQRVAEEALDALVPVGWLREPFAREVLHQREFAGAVDLLTRRMPDPEQALALRDAFPEYERTKDLPALEAAVVDDHAARTVTALAAAGRDAMTLLRFTRRGIDERNLLVVLRLRDAPSELSFERMLLSGGSVPLAAFKPALRTTPPSGVVVALATSAGRHWQPPLERWAASGDLYALERDLERRRILDATALFVHGDPLAIDVPMAFAAAKRTEARNLRLLAESSVRGIPADTARDELLRPEARA